MEGASSLFAGLGISISVPSIGSSMAFSQDHRRTMEVTYDLARIFLRLRLRRRVRFFLHLALIFKLLTRLVHCSRGYYKLLESYSRFRG